MLELPYEKYRIVSFAEILGRLDPVKVLADLERLTEGQETVLPCFERPPFSAAIRCHRRRVVDWFAEALQLEGPEIRIVP